MNCLRCDKEGVKEILPFVAGQLHRECLYCGLQWIINEHIEGIDLNGEIGGTWFIKDDKSSWWPKGTLPIVREIEEPI